MRLLWRTWRHLCAPSARRISSDTAAAAAVIKPSDSPALYRTSVTDPSLHSARDEGLVYVLDEDERRRLMTSYSMKTDMRELSTTLDQVALVVRRPALEIIDCLRQLDATTTSSSSSQPRVCARFVVFGRYGVGRTCILQHVAVAGARMRRVLLHFPELDRWGMRASEPVDSDPANTDQQEEQQQMVDHPVDAVRWLVHFRVQNEQLLNELALTTGQQRHVWSQREATEPGTPLMQLVQLGIDRAKLASGCMRVLLNELRVLAAAGKCRLLVVAERVNCVWTQGASRVKLADRTPVHYSRFTALQGLLPLLSESWTGGDVVCSAVSVGMAASMEHVTPRELLGGAGWEAMDPFVPVEVDVLNRRECRNYLHYLADNGWLQRSEAITESGIKQLYFLSGGNFTQLMRLCDMC